VGTFNHLGERDCGVLTFQNGDEFSGEFLNGKRYMGVMTFANSIESYKGEFNAEGQFHGSGKHTNEEGDVYSGDFVNGLREGEGELVLAND
jgi:hypothetical protein